MLWYQHTIVLKDCRASFNSAVKDFCYVLAGILQLNPVMYAEHPWPNDDTRDFIPGTTGVLVIETSHIAVHTCEKLKSVMVEVVSCKPFSREDMESVSATWFVGRVTDKHCWEYSV